MLPVTTRTVCRVSRSRLVVVALAAAVLTSTSCGDDDDDGAGERTTTTAPEQTTTTTQPQASGEGQQEAFAIVEDLVLEAADLTDSLFQDPSLATADDSPEVERLREIYTEDSPTPPDVLGQLEDLASAGQRVQAASSGVFREFLVHNMAAVDAATIRFNFCANQDQETVDADGDVVERFAEISQGAGEARYEDGRWQFYGLNRNDEDSLPTTPGEAQPGFCEQLYGGPGEA
jgi:hypothetical protein